MKDISTRISSVLASDKFFYGCIAWFLLQGVLIAATIKLGLPPDENEHLGIIAYFASNNFNPFAPQTGSFFLGDVEREVSYIYHLLLAPFYTLFSYFGNLAPYALRIINVIFGASSLFILKKIGEQLSMPRHVTHFTVFALSSTLMFVFLNASVNYDNLVNLIALTSFYVTILLLQKFSIRRVLGLVALILFGSLAKYTYLPLAVILSAIASWSIYTNRSQLASMIGNFFKRRSWQSMALIAVLVLLLGLFAERIGGNLLMYGKVNPRCNVVHTIEECQESALFSRNYALSQEEAEQQGLMSIFEFAPRWTVQNIPGIYGIYAHRSLSLPFGLIAPILIALLLAGIGVIRKIQPRKEPILTLLLSVSAMYLAVVMYVNYGNYLDFGRFGMALQGRYTFIVLPILYLTAFHYLYKLMPRFSTYIFLVLLAPFILSSAPALFTLIDTDWYSQFGNQIIGIKYIINVITFLK